MATRAKLLDIAAALVARDGYRALRVEEIVASAGVAKGTFFAHFADKDTLVEQLVGADIGRILDVMETKAPPEGIEELVDLLMPRIDFMMEDRSIFDLIIRRSCMAFDGEPGPVAALFGRQIAILAPLLAKGPFRRDVDPGLLAEGVQALETQAMVYTFCQPDTNLTVRARLALYLDAWLLPEPR